MDHKMAGGSEEAEHHSKYDDGGRRYDHYDSFYNMNHKYRGKALIFSHDKYDLSYLDERRGNDKDSQRLEKCLKELSFSVDVFSNLKYAEIMKQIDQTAKMDHSENDCLLIMVLTHGESHSYLYAKDTYYRVEKLWRRFTDENCATLAGKPKLFIIQACQGDKVDDGITLTTNYTEADGSFFKPHKVPFHRDFLLALSTVPGYVSWRHKDFGSWFIQDLCEELELSATTTDILTLLTFVNQKVALNYETYNEEKPFLSDKKGVPYFSSLLTRRLVFTKKLDSSISDQEGPLPRSVVTRAGSGSSTSSRKKSVFDYFGACLGY